MIKKYFFLILFAYSVSSMSQVKGYLSGYVYDEISNEPLIGATIIVENSENGTTTDFNGRFEFNGLEPKSYNISISYLGYKPKTIFNIIVKSIYFI